MPLSSFFPVTQHWLLQILLLLLGLALSLQGSEYLMRWFVRGFVKTTSPDPEVKPEDRISPTDETGVGRVIGKCENVLVYVLVLLGRFDGIGLVLAAKSIARMDAMKKNPSYYLGGTLVNFTWSLLVALLARLLVFGPLGRS